MFNVNFLAEYYHNISVTVASESKRSSPTGVSLPKNGDF